jgi:hypothetical protein
MPMTAPAPDTDQAPLTRDTPFMAAVLRLFGIIAESLPDGLPEPVDVFIAGGVALHALTGARVSQDVDSIFSHRILVPQDLVVGWRDEQGVRRSLCFDYNYAPVFGLLHPDYAARAIPVAWRHPKPLRLYVLAPADLAVTKLARFADNDRADIRLLIERGLLTDAPGFRALATEALSYYVGNGAFIVANLDQVTGWIQSASPTA